MIPVSILQRKVHGKLIFHCSNFLQTKFNKRFYLRIDKEKAFDNQNTHHPQHISSILERKKTLKSRF